jgi:hypothetical protein
MGKPAWVEGEGGAFVRNDDSPRAKAARAYQRRLKKAENEEAVREALAIVRWASQQSVKEVG